MKKFLFLLMLMCAYRGEAQSISVGEYQQQVVDFSRELTIAQSESERAEHLVELGYTAFLPKLTLDGDFTLMAREFSGAERWHSAVVPQILQTLYGGGEVRARYRSAQLGRDIALAKVDYTEQEVVFAARYHYWQLSARERFVDAVSHYVSIIDSLRGVVEYRFEQGYTSKSDVLMITSRLSDAQFQLLSLRKSYTIALHNFNSLRGAMLDAEVELIDNVDVSEPEPRRIVDQELLVRRADYSASQLGIARSDEESKITRAAYNPKVSLVVRGQWQTYVPNRDGSTYVDGAAVVKLSVPIWGWGARRKAVRAANQTTVQAELSMAQLADNIALEESDGWSEITLGEAQVASSRQSLRIATENLDLSTYSYTEGVATILDVMQAQISWIELYSNAIDAEYNRAVAIANYRRITVQ